MYGGLWQHGEPHNIVFSDDHSSVTNEVQGRGSATCLNSLPPVQRQITADKAHSTAEQSRLTVALQESRAPHNRATRHTAEHTALRTFASFPSQPFLRRWRSCCRWQQSSAAARRSSRWVLARVPVYGCFHESRQSLKSGGCRQSAGIRSAPARAVCNPGACPAAFAAACRLWHKSFPFKFFTSV